MSEKQNKSKALKDEELKNASGGRGVWTGIYPEGYKPPKIDLKRINVNDRAESLELALKKKPLGKSVLGNENNR